MDIQSLKINFVQEFLKIQNKQVINTLVLVLRKEKEKLYESEMKAMTQEKLDDIIDQDEIDVKEDKLTEARQLKKNIKSWQ